MKKFLLTTTALLGLIASAAAATPFTDQVISGLQAQGFERIEISQGSTQLKVEAIRGTTKVEIIYDLATGAVLKQETETVVAGDDTTPGIEIDTEEGDFIDVNGDDSAGGSVEDAAELADDAEDDAAVAADDAEDAAAEAADDAEDDAAEAADDAEDAAAEAADDAEDAADEGVDDSADESADDHADDSTDEGVDDSADESADDHADDSADEGVDDSADEGVDDSADESVDESDDSEGDDESADE